MLPASVRLSEVVTSKIKVGERGVLEAIAEQRGTTLSELIRLLAFGQAQEVFLTDILGPALHAAFVGAPSRAGSINPGGVHEDKAITVDKTKQSSIAIWVRAQPLVWRTNQGDLLPSERKTRTELLKEYGGDTLEDLLASKIGSPAVSLEDLAEAYGHLDRLTFALEFLGYIPQPKVEASRAGGLAELEGPRSKKRGVSARPLKRV